ncbi:hypothetical protein [Aquimarina sp. MMG016]|uniref:hypothetical protein n=1 Tax=Aquimarina sp. MMG016 TaxID=2822690 RepID=UPI001B3A7263|nr:hypothetical protein [Aquimarina sp. MMG016]MBQ4818602.1 hypothetical protein [Aquimarina sp. MMG016]
MTILKIIVYIIGSLILLAILFIGLIKLLVYLGDRGAERKGRKYCELRGYTFKKVEAFPNHYGLYFKKGGMHFYSSFHYERNGSLTWIKGSPEEKIEARLRKKEETKSKTKVQ